MHDEGDVAISPPSGGNPFLDKIVSDNPGMLQRMWEAGTMPPDKAYMHLYGEAMPWSGLSQRRNTFIQNHGALQQMIMKNLAENYLDPAYGMDVGTGAKMMGMRPEDLATPSQMKRGPMVDVPGPDPSNIQGPPAPYSSAVQTIAPTFLPVRYPQRMSADHAEVSSPELPSNLTPPATAPKREIIDGLVSDEPYFRRPGTKVQGPDVVDTSAKMDAAQRQIFGAYVKRTSSPWSTNLRGLAANVENMAETAAALRGLEPGTAQYADYVANFIETKGGVVKADYRGGEGAGKAKSQGQLADTRRKILEPEAANADKSFQAKLDNLNERTAAIKFRTEIGRTQNVIEERLKTAQAELAEMKVKGNIPEREIANKEAITKELQNKAEFLAAYVMMLDKKGIVSPEGEMAALDIIAEHSGLSGGIHDPSLIERGKSVLGMSPPAAPVERTKVPRTERNKHMQEGSTVPDEEKLKTAGDSLAELAKALGDLKDKEGKTYKNPSTGQRVTVKGGKLVPAGE